MYGSAECFEKKLIKKIQIIKNMQIYPACIERVKIFKWPLKDTWTLAGKGAKPHHNGI